MPSNRPEDVFYYPICKEADIGGYKTNHSLHATTNGVAKLGRTGAHALAIRGRAPPFQGVPENYRHWKYCCGPWISRWNCMKSWNRAAQYSYLHPQNNVVLYALLLSSACKFATIKWLSTTHSSAPREVHPILGDSMAWISLRTNMESAKYPNFSGGACPQITLLSFAFCMEVVTSLLCPHCALASTVSCLYTPLATAATRLYQSGVDEQLVMERTGHHNLEGVCSYKRTSDTQCQARFDILNCSKKTRTDSSYEICSVPTLPAVASSTSCSSGVHYQYWKE